MKNIIFVGPHPDDIELGCGGAIFKLTKTEEYRVICVHLTKGGRIAEEKRRVQQCIAACHSLGVNKRDIHFGSFKDTEIPVNYDVINYLEGFFYEYQEDLWGVFIPSQEDTHQDHRATHYCCLAAFRHSSRIYAYQSPSVFGSFNPTSYIDITGALEAKEKALSFYESVVGSREYLEYESVLNIAKYNGRQPGVELAEAFQTIRNLIEL